MIHEFNDIFIDNARAGHSVYSLIIHREEFDVTD